MVGYPKQTRRQRKRRIRHPESILQKKDGTCYLCIRLHNDYVQHRYLEEHHIFPGNPGRRISEEYGLKVYLCAAHHRDGVAAVHRNQKMMRMLQREAQRQWEKTHTREEWMELIGRNYL